MPRRKRPIPTWLRRLLVKPTAQLNRWEYALRFVAELARHGMKQLKEDRAGQMAAALAFRTIFGLVPVTAIGLLIFRVLGGIDRFESFVRDVLAATPLESVSVPQPGGAPAEQGAEAATVPLIEWLMDTIRQINTNVNFESIGMVGLLILVWAAIGMMTTIERSFNTICRASENRPLSRRVPLYGFTIIIGPGLLYLSFFLDRRFHEIVTQFADKLGPWAASSLSAVGVITSIGTTWLFIMLLYVSVPNTKVKVSAAAFGSLVTAVCWSVGARGLGAYISTIFGTSSSYSVLYGTLGLIPVFLFWVYAMWIIVLFGLELTSSLQAVGVRMVRSIPDRPHIPPVMDPALVLPMMRVIAERFENGESTDARHIMEQTRINERAIELVLATLAQRGVVHRVEPEDRPTFTLARPPGKIALTEVVDSTQKLLGSEDAIGADWSMVSSLREAQLGALKGRTLADILRDRK